MSNIVIIGSGWYGLHIANLLKCKHTVTLIEKDERIFSRSSYYNQNRLHLGYHYPRDHKTRNLCQRNYNQFCEKYKECIDHIPNNYYIISKDSIIDYNTYKSIYCYEDFDFDEVGEIFTNIQGKIINTKEGVINSDRVRNYFENNMDNINLLLSSKVVSILRKDDRNVVVYEKK